MAGPDLSQLQGLTAEGIVKLEKLKSELEALSFAMQNMHKKDKYEVEGRVRAFQDKEAEVRQFLRELGITT